jgi:hypothetical protein
MKKPGKWRPFRKQIHRWKDSIRWMLIKYGGGCKPDSPGLCDRSCEHGNELSHFIKGRKCLTSWVTTSFPRILFHRMTELNWWMLYYAFHLHNSFMAQLYHTFFPYNMFRPNGAIFRYVRVYTITFCFMLLSPHWTAFTHWECVVCMFFVCRFFRKIYCLLGYKKYQNIKLLY